MFRVNSQLPDEIRLSGEKGLRSRRDVGLSHQALADQHGLGAATREALGVVVREYAAFGHENRVLGG